MKLNRPGSDCSLNHWIMLLAFQHEPFRWEPLLHDSTNLFTCTLKDCCVSNAQLITPQEITGLPPWCAPPVCGWSGKPCSWKKTEAESRFSSALLEQSWLLFECFSRVLSYWRAVGEKAVVHTVWWAEGCFLIVLIHREFLDLSVTRSCVSHVL